MGYFDRHRRALYQRFQWNFNWWQFWTAAGLPEERAFNTNTHTTFNNTWSFHMGSTFGQLGETYCYSSWPKVLPMWNDHVLLKRSEEHTSELQSPDHLVC